MFIISILVSVIVGSGGLWYSYLIYKDQVKPVIASWLILTVMLSISFLNYWFGKNHSVQGNIAHFVSAISTAQILLTLVAFSWWRGTLMVAFSYRQKICLELAVLVLIVWFFTANATLAFLLNQGVMVIGFFPLVERLWNLPEGQEDGESVVTWGTVVIGTCVGVYNTFAKQDPLAFVYAVRAIVTAGLVVYLIVRIRRRNAMKKKLVEELVLQ